MREAGVVAVWSEAVAGGYRCGSRGVVMRVE